MMKIFKKKEERKETPPPVRSEPPKRPKIVIKQRRASSAPLPNSIANSMAPNSMPHDRVDPAFEEGLRDSQETRMEAEVETAPKADIDTTFFENRISELKKENRALFAKIDTIEKSSESEITELNDNILNQKSNYAALEDEFLKRKEEIDGLKSNLEDLTEDYNMVCDDLDEARETTVAKKDLQNVQVKLREHVQVRADLETQLETMRKDQSRYETMVSELSAHITDLKDSLDGGSSEEQYAKLMAVKDTELERGIEYISDLEEQVKSLQSTKKELKELIHQKDSIIDVSQDWESKLNDSIDEVHDLNDKLELVSEEKRSAEDQMSVYASDLEILGVKIKEVEEKIKSEIDAHNFVKEELLVEQGKYKKQKSDCDVANKLLEGIQKEKDAFEQNLIKAEGTFEQRLTEGSNLNAILNKEIVAKNSRIGKLAHELEELSARMAENNSDQSAQGNVEFELRDSLRKKEKEASDLFLELEKKSLLVKTLQEDNSSEGLKQEILTLTNETQNLKESFKEKESKLEEEKESLIADAEKLQTKLSTLESDDSLGAMEEKYNDLVTEKEEVDLSLAQAISDLEDAEKLKISISKSEGIILGLKSETLKLGASLESAETKISVLKSDDSIGKLNAEFERVSEENRSLVTELNQAQARLESAESMVSAMESDDSIEKLNVELERVFEKNSSLETELKEVKESLEEQLADHSKEDLQSELNTLNTQFGESQEREGKLNDELAKHQELISELELTSNGKDEKIEELLAEIESSANSDSERDESTELIAELEAKVKALKNGISEMEVENSSLKDQLSNVSHQATVAIEDSVVEEEAEITDGHFLLNLVLKPDNDEYELELPGNMTGKEIKVELTDAGLLDGNMSYDLFFPRIDKLIMNKELLADCNINQGEVMEVIPGGM